MQTRNLGRAFPVSVLTLGGGGIGQVWGTTDREESIATVKAAHRAGINLFDMAPLYGRGEAETVLGLAFPDGYPDDVRVTTKCMLGTVPSDEVLPKLRTSIQKSLERLRRSSIDLFILHGYVVPDGFGGGPRAEILPKIVVPTSLFESSVIPALMALVEDGLIGAWGVTAAGPINANLQVLDAERPPAAVQCITNLLDSPGSMSLDDEVPQPRRIVDAARDRGIGVMGIRAVAAGSLTDSLDREVDSDSAEQRDFERASAFRQLAREQGTSAAALAHRYALSMPGIDTVVLGVKNREELEECLEAESAGPLSAAEMMRIDQTI